MGIAELVMLADEEFLREAYRFVLGREVDASGLQGYQAKLAGGASKERVLADLARSNEARDRFAPPVLLNLPDEEFIDSVYVRLLGRNADASGMLSYIAQLRMHGDRRRIIRDIGMSEEARRYDPSGWTMRRELEDLVRREMSVLRWRKWGRWWMVRAQKAASKAKHQKFEASPEQTPHSHRAESAQLKDQMIMLASALEGVLAAQHSYAARLDALSSAVEDLKCEAVRVD